MQVGRDAVDDEHARDGEEPTGIAAGAALLGDDGNVGLGTGIELSDAEQCLDADQDVRVVQARHAGGVGERGGRVVGQRGPTGDRRAGIGRADLVERRPARPRTRGQRRERQQHRQKGNRASAPGGAAGTLCRLRACGDCRLRGERQGPTRDSSFGCGKSAEYCHVAVSSGNRVAQIDDERQLVSRPASSIAAIVRHWTEARILPAFESMWMIQKASTSSWLIIATTPACGAKK